MYDTVDEAKQGLKDYIRFCNTEREHSGIAYLTPTRRR